MRDSVRLAILAAALPGLARPLMSGPPPARTKTSTASRESPSDATGCRGSPTSRPATRSRSTIEPTLPLYALPPLSFYWQGLAHLALGDGLGQARLASALAGIVAVFLVYDLGRSGSRIVEAPCGEPGSISFRALFCSPATMARPDMAATASVWLPSGGEPGAMGRKFPRRGNQRGLRRPESAGPSLGNRPRNQVGLAILLLRRSPRAYSKRTAALC